MSIKHGCQIFMKRQILYASKMQDYSGVDSEVDEGKDDNPYSTLKVFPIKKREFVASD